MKFHPGNLVLEEFYLALGEENRSLLAHLARCPNCLARFRGLVETPAEAPAHGQGTALPPVTPEEAFLLERGEGPQADRERAVLKERVSAPGLLVELTSLSPEKQLLLIRNSPRFRTWGLYELLVEQCRETTVRHPRGVETLARLALEVASRLDEAFYGEGLVHDLQARAWGHLGNARRVCSDLVGADEAFMKAEACLRQGSRDPLEYASLLDLKASLRRSQRRFEDAQKHLRQAVAIFRRMGNLHRAGRCLVSMDLTHCYAGHPERGIPLLYQAIEMIDADKEPRLLLCARHNLFHDLVETERFVEAQKIYRETRSLYREFPDEVTQSRRRWVKGRLSLGLGRTAQAERLFLTARDGFIAEELSYDTALVSLDLAALYVREGRTADLKRLSREMLSIFTSLQIHREALAALSFLRKALEAERASLELVARVAQFLRRAEHDPGLRFEP